MKEQESSEKRDGALWNKFQEWFRVEHPGDWSRRNQLPEWKAFQAGAKAVN
jgi:hypothetical protein